MTDPNPIGTGPTKWRAEHCVTHHHACDCREWAHACEIERLEAALEAAREDAARLDWLDTQRGDDVQGSYPSPPELVGHYWSVEGQCYDVRDAIDASRILAEPGEVGS